MMITLFFFFLVSLISHKSNSLIIPLNPKVVSTDFTLSQSNHFLKNISYSLPSMNLCFGLPNPQCFDLILSTTAPFTLLESSNSLNQLLTHQLNETASLTNNQTFHIEIHFDFLYLKNYNVIGYSMADSITIPSLSHTFKGKQFMFVALRISERQQETVKKHIDLDGYIGLSKNCYLLIDNNLSLVNYLFISHAIERENFALSYKSDGSGLIFLGENYKNKAMCEINPFSRWNDWDCLMTGLQIGTENRSGLNRTLIFDSIMQYVEVDRDVGLMIFDVIIKLNGDKCKLITNSENSVLVCEEGIDVKSLPDLHLIMRNINIVLKWQYLMKETYIDNKLKLVSMLIINERMRKEVPWRMGIPVFLNRIVIFDRETQRVGFIDEFNDCENKTLLFLKMIIIMLSCAVLLLLYIHLLKLKIKGVNH